MASNSTRFFAYGFVGYEQEFDSKVQTNLIFALADEGQTVLAWYGFKAAMRTILHETWFLSLRAHPERHEWQLDSNFATAEPSQPDPTVLPIPFSIAQLAVPLNAASSSWGGVYADLDLHDEEGSGFTRCVLSVPSVRPTGVTFDFFLRTKRKRLTFDLSKPGSIYSIGIEGFSRRALLMGPNLALLRQHGFRK